MKRLLLILSLLLALHPEARAFCGFYVAKADTKLFNEASKVVLVRDGNRTVLTMSSDYRGELREFAVVIPVPTFIEREQIHIASAALIDHLDAFTAPRLVEYYDDNPCEPRIEYEMMRSAMPGAVEEGGSGASAQSLGVKIEAQYTVGEYDILILSAEQSSGLEMWLRQNGYRIPEGAGEVLGSYLKQGMRFFVAKVNLAEQAKLGHSFLRPIQVAYESPKFMLPIRLGMVNANGSQELFIFALTRNGRIESTNYRTVKLSEGAEVPLFVKDDFTKFYKAMFAEQVKKENSKAVFVEHAWDTGSCDPCSSEPLSAEELRELGVFWLDSPLPTLPRRMIMPSATTFVTRLHVRYDSRSFPEDLTFQETGDRSNHQTRFVLRHPWTGSDTCEAATRYRGELRRRQEQEAQTLASLTGWEVGEIRSKMSLGGPGSPGEKWWKKIWR